MQSKNKWKIYQQQLLNVSIIKQMVKYFDYYGQNYSTFNTCCFTEFSPEHLKVSSKKGHNVLHRGTRDTKF